MPRRSAHGAEEEEEEGGGSECSSGCESGWTMYLDQSDEKTCRQDGEEEGEEEDLSMVSDASSGPPHYHEEDLFCDSCSDGDQDHLFCDSKKDCKRRRVEAEMQQKQREEEEEEETWGLLDDTASSPFLSFPKKNINMATAKLDPPVDGLEISCGFSATHLEGKSTLHDQFNYFRSTSATRPKNCREGGGKNKIW